VALALIFVAHLALSLHFAPPKVLFGDAPVLQGSYSVEVYRAARARLAWASDRRLWAYDPQVLAGQPAGLTERFGTRAFVYGMTALTGAGIDPLPAFGAILFSLHLLVPLVGLGVSLAAGLARRATAVVVGLWSALWFFDALVHSSWFSGRAPWCVASAFAVLAAALAARVQSGKSPWWAVGIAASELVAFLLHPVVATFGALVSLAVVVRDGGLLPARRAALFAGIALPLGALSVFGGRAVATSSEPVQHVFDVGPSELFWDAVEVLGPGYGAPGAARTLVRVACTVIAALGLLAWRRSDDRRFSAFAALAASAFVIAYFGALVPAPWPVDPYYFAIVSAFACAVPAADFVANIRFRELARRSFLSRLVFVLAFLVVVPRLYRTVATYLPSLLPTRVIRSPPDLHVSSLVGLHEPAPDPMAHEAPPAAFEIVASLLENALPDGARVAVSDPELTGYLAVRSGLAVLGPIAERGGPSVDADPTPILDPKTPAHTVANYLDRYGVTFVVASGYPSSFDAANDRLEPPVFLGGLRVRRVRAPASLFVAGTGRIAVGPGGSIRVSDASGPRVTLRYHFDSTFRCEPGCTVERATVDSDRTGFVSVPNPPPAFRIF
jgi:hypothetical protein